MLVIDPGRGKKETQYELTQPDSDTTSFRVYVNTLESFTGNQAGSYALSSLKKMTVTDNFMELDQEIKNCDVEIYEECNTRRYLDAVQRKCGCVPWALGNAAKQKVSNGEVR